jgi:hypothetical protein
MRHKGTLPSFEKLIKLGIESLRLTDTTSGVEHLPYCASAVATALVLN